MPITPFDLEMIDRCVILAQNGDSRVFPNPRVGAIVVQQGQILGEGWHVQAGLGHAEVNAINQCGNAKLNGATIYVSLEPCGHFGRTPPCAQLLIDRGFSRVVIGASDPGRGAGGAQLLKKSGIEVEILEQHSACIRLLEPFVKNTLHRQAYLLQKWAMSLDGKIALPHGDSRWITGLESRQSVHRQRTVCDGIMVGAGTVLADRPQLNVRHDQSGPVPRPIIWDPKGRTSELSDWWNSLADRRPMVLTDMTEISWPETVTVESRWQPEDLCATLFIHGFHSVLVEGGAGLHGWLADHHLADAVQVYISTKILGGQNSLSPVGGQGLSSVSLAQNLQYCEWQKMGEDLFVEGLVKKHHPS